ncbi:MAG: KTSC domain-containing protein [Acidobacteria bacterium]|nr:KTSC domain-containing protein [Acidobacteriota bacterium]
MTRAQCVYTALDCSELTAAAYATHGTPELQFRTGAIYLYFAIPPAVFPHFTAASSKGACFDGTIRNRFRYQRVA